MTSEAGSSWRNSLAAYAHPRVRSMLFLAFSAGLAFPLVLTTLSLRLREAGIDRTTIGWTTSYLIMAACVAVGVVTTFVISEPDAHIDRATLAQEARVISFLERSAHWPEHLRNAVAWIIGAVVCPFVDFFARNGLKH